MFAKSNPPRIAFKIWPGTLLGLFIFAALSSAQAQNKASEPVTETEQSTPAKPTPPRRNAGELKPVTITGAAINETEDRRQSTASKIIVGRDEIERFGDDTMGELLKRLPGVTMPGRPGRGGAPRMRGLGGGYTQILIDGEPAARGFSLDDLSPEQVERIEILRAPTAETGARAIAGTINVITRGGYSKKLNDLRVGASFENGNTQPGFSWTRNDTAGPWTYNLSASAQHHARKNDSVSETVTENLVTGDVINQTERTLSTGKHDGLQANARL